MYARIIKLSRYTWAFSGKCKVYTQSSMEHGSTVGVLKKWH